MERRYWVIVFVLGLLAVGTEALLWLVRERTNEQTFAGPPRSDYTLGDFTLDALDSAGKRTFQVSGPRLARRGDDGSIFVDSPAYALVDGTGHPWSGKSDSAWVDKEGSVMKLLGHVEMHRAGDDASDPVDVVTRDLTTRPKAKTMETAAAATITRPGSILRGTGLRGDLNEKSLELLSDVSSTLQSRHARDDAQ
ncbi:MAG TPA: LPS export ABC transporter periplasmic protein LptC [Dokdonella sp.]|nr:LPS export ABC transporter periplasmic protein LptC [Dokdonella sp.]